MIMFRLLLFLAVLTFPRVILAQEVSQSASLVPLGYCQLTSIASATAISTCSGGIPKNASIAIIAVEAAGVRWRDDGTNPTASIGMPIASGSTLTYQGGLAALVFIAQTGSPILNISFYKYRGNG